MIIKWLVTLVVGAAVIFFLLFLSFAVYYGADPSRLVTYTLEETVFPWEDPYHQVLTVLETGEKLWLTQADETGELVQHPPDSSMIVISCYPGVVAERWGYRTPGTWRTVTVIGVMGNIVMASPQKPGF